MPKSPTRKRVLAIRRRVATGAVVLFLAVFGGLTFQLTSGNDPALSAGASSNVVTAAASDSAADKAKQAASTTSTSTAVSPVTTAQS